MQIRIKPELVSSNEGFDFIGRPTSSKTVHSKVAELQNQHWRSIRENKQKGIFVYWKEKHRKKTIVQQKLTKTGKVSKKLLQKQFLHTGNIRYGLSLMLLFNC